MSGSQLALVRKFNAEIAAGAIAREEAPCLCGERRFALLAAYDRYRIDQPTVICESCGLIQSMPRLTADETARFYASDLYRALYNPDLLAIDRARLEELVLKCTHRHAYVAAERGERRLDRVLEIGCGGGWNLYPFRAPGRTLLGYDLSPTLVSFGRTVGLDLRVGGLDDISEVGFDLIILSHVVEHFLDPVAELRKAARLLAPDGVLYIEVPNMEGFCVGALQNAHAYYFTPATLAHYAALAGLASASIERIGPHMRGLFRPSASAVRPDLGRELVAMVRIVRAYERREAAKGLLAKVGVLGLARRTAALAR